MKTIVVLVMHGAPPRDYPKQKLTELLMLHRRIEQMTEAEKPAALLRFGSLDAEIRHWPRSAENDPFYIFSEELSVELGAAISADVIVGYNEFCAPDVLEALERAANKGAGRIIVVTPMMTRGGEHAELEIPALIREFKTFHPEIEVTYAWPFEKAEIALLLKQQIERYS